MKLQNYEKKKSPKPHLKRFYFLTFIDVTLSNQQLRATFHSTHVEHMHLWCAHRDILERLHVRVRNRSPPPPNPHCAHRQHVWKCFCTALVKALKQVRECLCAYVHTRMKQGCVYLRGLISTLPNRIFHLWRATERKSKKEKNQQIKRQSNTRISDKVSGTSTTSEVKA